jgi:hypothetical protein
LLLHLRTWLVLHLLHLLLLRHLLLLLVRLLPDSHLLSLRSKSLDVAILLLRWLLLLLMLLVPRLLCLAHHLCFDLFNCHRAILTESWRWASRSGSHRRRSHSLLLLCHFCLDLFQGTVLWFRLLLLLQLHLLLSGV